MSVKVVINACYGGFSLSPEALLRLWDLGFRDNIHRVDEYYGYSRDERLKEDLDEWRTYQKTGEANIFLTVFSPDEKYVLDSRPGDYETRHQMRAHPLIVQVVEELGEKANGSCASLKVVEIPYGVSWHIAEYDGHEHIAEDHQTWY